MSVSVSVPPDQRRSGWRSLNSDRAPPPASRPARCAMSASSTGRIRSQYGAMSRSWHSPSSAAISASDSRGRASSSRALSGHGCPSHTRCRLARTAAAGVARSRASSASSSGILTSGAGTRNSGWTVRPLTMSGHSRGSRSGRQPSSLRAHRTQGAFTAGVSGCPAAGRRARLAQRRDGEPGRGQVGHVQLEHQQHAPHLARLCSPARGFSTWLKRSRSGPALASLAA